MQVLPRVYKLGSVRWWAGAVTAVALLVVAATPARVLIPSCAGVLGWRLLVRERGIERLVVLGTVAGLGLFWIGFTLFARWLPPRPAAHLVAGTMAAAVALCAWRLRRQSRQLDAWPGPTQSPLHTSAPLAFALPVGWRLFALLAAAVVTASVYAASGTLSSFGETMQHHVPLVASFQRGNWPPIDLREPPHALEYHWGMHALAAGLGALAGSDAADLALFATNSVAAGLAFATAFVVTSRHAGPTGGAAAALLLVGAGTLNWLSAPGFAVGGALAPLLDPMGYPFTTGNLIVGGFFWRLHTNSTSWAVCTLLLASELMALCWERRRWGPALAALPALALVAPTNETTFCAAVAALGVATLLKAAIDRRRPAFALLSGLGVTVGGAALAPLLGGVLATFLSTGTASHQAAIVLNREHLGSVPSWDFAGLFKDPPWIPILSGRFLQDVGPLPWLALPAGLLALRRRAWPLVIVAATAVVLLLASTTFSLTRYPANMFRLLSASVTLGGMAAGYALAVLVASIQRRRVRAAMAALGVVAVLFLVAAWPLSWVGLTCCGRDFPWPKRNGGPMTDGGVVEWLKRNTSFREAILTLPAGLPHVEPSGQVYPMGSFVGGRPQYAEQARAALAGPDLEALRKMDVRYLYVSEPDLDVTQRAVLKRATDEGVVSPVWVDAARGRKLLRIHRQ